MAIKIQQYLDAMIMVSLNDGESRLIIAVLSNFQQYFSNIVGRHGRDFIVVGSITTYAISAYHH